MSSASGSLARVALRALREARSPARLLVASLLVAGAAKAHAQSLEVSDLGNLGGERAAAYAINQAGLIVGASLDLRPEKIAFVKPPGGPMLGLLGDRNARKAHSGARDVNARGEALVFYSFRSSRVSYELFLWTEAAGLVKVAHGLDEPVGLDDSANIVVNGVVEPTERRSGFVSRITAMILQAPD